MARKAGCRCKSVARLTAAALLSAACLSGLESDSSEAAETSRGAQLAAMCASCHRLDGQDVGIPKIVGLEKKKFTDMMADFKSDKRKSQIMNVVARSLSTEDIDVLAEYLAAQPKKAERP